MSDIVSNDNSIQNITFDAIRIGLASPEQIMKWSHGEVTKPETRFAIRALSATAAVLR